MKAVELLSKANNPVIVVGAGIKNNCSHESVLALAELINAPCCSSPGHGDALPFDHPLNAGQMGPRGNVVASRLVKEADVILVLGSRLGFNSTFYSYDNINKDASIIHCEIDENSIGRYFPIEVGIFADAKTVAEQLLTMLKAHKAKNEAQEWVKDFQAERKAYLEWEGPRISFLMLTFSLNVVMITSYTPKSAPQFETEICVPFSLVIFRYL